MNIKIIFLSISIIICSLHNYVFSVCDKNIDSTSFVLFTLQDNHVQIERYSFDEIKDVPVELSTETRKGHTLYKIGLSKSTTNASSLFFYPPDQRYLVILTKQKQQELDLLLSWAPLITQNIKQLLSIETVDFSIDHLEKAPWKTMLTCQFDTCKKSITLLFDTNIQAACGAFICDNCFDYDKGIFSRTFNQKEIETLGLLKKWDTTRPKGMYKQIKNLAMHTASIISNYTIAGLSTGKRTITKTISYLIATLKKIKDYFKKRKETKYAKEILHKSFDTEAEFDKLLEETMNSDLDFITEEKSKERHTIIQYGQRFGTYLLMRYIDLEQKLKNVWQKITPGE